MRQVLLSRLYILETEGLREASEPPSDTRTHNQKAEVSNSNSGPPKAPRLEAPLGARGSKQSSARESGAELEAGTVHLHANTQNPFPLTALLLMEALSLEPWKVWNMYFAPSLQL